MRGLFPRASSRSGVWVAPKSCTSGQISLQQLEYRDVVLLLCQLQRTSSCVVRNVLYQLRLKDCQRLGNSFLSPVAYWWMIDYEICWGWPNSGSCNQSDFFRASMRSEEVLNANDDREAIESFITDKWQIFQYFCFLRINHCLPQAQQIWGFLQNQHLLNSLLWETIHITQKSEKQVGRSANWSWPFLQINT